ncbi:MAG: hypothetical protein JW849_00770 [Phycisphaerae bacterium]|nr:hypothetical protein [Phycisphaerae bacterium]
MKSARLHSARFPGARRRGAVLVVVLTAIPILVGLLFFVYNLGLQVSRREDLQNTADAVATAGAGWMARSMNTVAMNNVGQAKLISTALVLDAVPLAAELAIKELQEDPERDDSLAKGLQRQLQRGVPNTRLEQGYAKSASYAKVVANAVLLLPGEEPVFWTLWPGDANSEVPALDYRAMQSRIQAVGTVLGNPVRTGDWSVSDAYNAYGGNSFETLDPEALAEWTTNINSTDGRFHVYAWWSSEKDGTHRYSSAKYTITTAGGDVDAPADQNRNSGAWVYLGTYTFPLAQGAADVRIAVHGPPDDPNRDQELTNFLRNGLEKLAREMAPSENPDEPTQYDELILLDQALNSTDEIDKEPGAYDVTEMTHWDAGGKRGRCWAAALAMRDLSDATAEKAGLLAQANAQQFGRDNDADTSFLTPMRPELACKQGTFEDFTPVLTGLFRVRLEKPQEAKLTLPIYEEVARINNLDDSLDDLVIVYQDIQQNLQDIEKALANLAGQTDWQVLEQTVLTIQQQANDIEARRQAIGERLNEMPRLAALGEKTNKTFEKIGQLLEEIQGDKDPAKLRAWLDELTELHQNSVSQDGLTELAMQEEELEVVEKETRLANLHATCPGGGIPDYVSSPFYRLGPYATLHRWRHGWWKNTNPPGWGGDPEVGPAWGYEHILGYTTYGPFRWCLEEITRSFGQAGSYAGALDVTRFAYYTQLGANIKLAYSYGVTHTQKIRYATRWITDYEAARSFAADPENRRKIIRTRYYRPLVMSSVPWDHPNWLKDRTTYWSHMGAWQTYWNGNGISPLDDPPSALWIWEPWGWYDVSVRQPQVKKFNNYTWWWSRSYSDVVYEHRLGLNERRSATKENTYIPWTIHLTSWYVFGGIQIAEEVVVSNPCNWPADEADKPRPLLMDYGPGDYESNHDAGVRRSHFTFLGLAGRSGSAPVWPEKFASGVPGGQATAVSQAEVFNNLSWDLWTQNWQSQLVPVSGWEDWLEQMAESLDDLPQSSECNCGIDFDEENIRALVESLQRINPELVQVFMNH